VLENTTQNEKPTFSVIIKIDVIILLLYFFDVKTAYCAKWKNGKESFAF